MYEETVHLLEHFDSLIKRSLLYEIAKPVVESIVSSISKAITASGTPGRTTTWGSERKVQFLEHVFARVRASLDVSSMCKRSAENIDSIIVDDAVAFIEALSLSSAGGTNFTFNQYVRSRVLEALMCTFLTSHRKVAIRLKIIRLSVPQLISKTRQRGCYKEQPELIHVGSGSQLRGSQLLLSQQLRREKFCAACCRSRARSASAVVVVCIIDSAAATRSNRS